jgi:hypothetical protein
MQSLNEPSSLSSSVLPLQAECLKAAARTSLNRASSAQSPILLEHLLSIPPSEVALKLLLLPGGESHSLAMSLLDKPRGLIFVAPHFAIMMQLQKRFLQSRSCSALQ